MVPRKFGREGKKQEKVTNTTYEGTEYPGPNMLIRETRCIEAQMGPHHPL